MKQQHPKAPGSLLLPAPAVRGLGIGLIVLGVTLPFAVLAWRAASWQPPSGAQGGPEPLRPEMVILEPGTFEMGSPENEEGRDPDETLHTVTLTRPFALSRTEVTQGQYFAVMEAKPVEIEVASAGPPCAEAGVGDDLPVVCVRWLDAVAYCNALSEREGLTPAYTLSGEDVTWNETADGYRLPTEAEWEYAARAGTRYRWVGTDNPAEVCDYANVADASLKERYPQVTPFDCDDTWPALAPVDARRPNRWQLLGMGGNAAEWVWDGYDGAYYREGPTEDPKGPEGASDRVNRGGSWRLDPRLARVAYRYRDVPSVRYDSLGFRVARSLPSTP